MDWLDATIDRLRQEGLLREPVSLSWDSPTDAWLRQRRVTVFCGNDYLGLRRSNILADAATVAARQDGVGAGASRLVSGNLLVHEVLESSVCNWLALSSALTTSSGYAANVGAIAALASHGDVVFSDARNHASIIDGCRLARANVVVLASDDPDDIATHIRKARPFHRGWLITESMFSMDGCVAPLTSLRALADREGLAMYVDEAHAVGVLGPEGSGALREANVRADVVVATLGKAVGAAGAVVAGSAALRTFLWNRCRSFVFSTGIAAPIAAAATAAIAAIRSEPERRARLARNTARLRAKLSEAGVPVGGDSRSPIMPFVLQTPERALAASAALLERGFFVQAIRPPTVPEGTSRLRITVSAAHSDDAIDAFVDAMRAIA